MTDGRPRSRIECPGSRPCPWVSCRHNLAVHVTKQKKIKLPLGEDPAGWGVNCALDYAVNGGMSLGQIAELLGVTRERIRQVEVEALSSYRENADLHFDVECQLGEKKKTPVIKICTGCQRAFVRLHHCQAYCHPECRMSFRHPRKKPKDGWSEDAAKRALQTTERRTVTAHMLAPDGHVFATIYRGRRLHLLEHPTRSVVVNLQGREEPSPKTLCGREWYTWHVRSPVGDMLCRLCDARHQDLT